MKSVNANNTARAEWGDQSNELSRLGLGIVRGRSLEADIFGAFVGHIYTHAHLVSLECRKRADVCSKYIPQGWAVGRALWEDSAGVRDVIGGVNGL